MADDKGKAPPAAPPPSKDAFVEIAEIIIGGLVLLYLANSLFLGIQHNRLFSLGWKAFTKEGIYLSHSLPIAALNNPIGVRVYNKNNVNVYDSPNGNKIGEQPQFAEGKILQGPVVIDGINYWYVDYDSGTDGWVRESGILYLQSQPNLAERIFIWVGSLVGLVRILIFVFCILAIVGIFYLVRELTKLRVTERKSLYVERTIPEPPKNPQWQIVLTHIESTNQNDWRQAILEADIILSSLLDTMFLPGETIGDKLKSVEKADFRTIDNAWEAHKTRNQIAHEGSNFKIDQKEAKRVVDLYRSVFEEFSII